MTPPMTPREKVELKPCPFCGGDAVAGSNFDNDHYVMCGADCDKCGGMVGYMKTEMAAIENWNRRTALASGSGDHAELAEIATRCEEHWLSGPQEEGAIGVVVRREQLEALLAENAALRGDLNRKHEACQIAQDQAMENGARATEAERKLAEAVELLTRWFDTRGEVLGAGTVETATSTFLSKDADRDKP